MKQLCNCAVLASLAFGASIVAAEEPAFETYPKIVDFTFVEEQAVVPRRDDVTIVDSRPERKFNKGHIPVAVNISDTLFEDQKDRLPENKDDLLVFYCGGLKCPLSHKSAFKAEDLGYTNIRVYAAGYPDWTANGGLAGVSPKYVKNMVEGGDGVLVDARPPRKFNKGHVTGAVSVPTTRFDEMHDALPEDKDTELVFYCGGYRCTLSVKGAMKAKELGYTNAKVFQAGYPAWEDAYGSEELAIKEAGEEGLIAIDSFMNILENHPDEVYLVDVRDQAEVDMDGTFASAQVIPIDTLLEQIADMPSDKPTVFFCSNGARAGEAYDFVNMKRSDMKAYFLEAEVAFKKQPLPEVSLLD